MRTKYWFLSFVILWSCGNNTELPQNVLSKEEMVDILLEVYVAQAKIGQERSIKKDSAEILYSYYQNYILQNKNTDTTTFYSSLTYYFEHPEDFDKINEIVLDSLNLRLEKMEALEEKQRNEKPKTNSESLPK